jgi:hypothetical protein
MISQSNLFQMILKGFMSNTILGEMIPIMGVLGVGRKPPYIVYYLTIWIINENRSRVDNNSLTIGMG